MKSFSESGYKFEFTDDWKVIKYDDHRFYRVLSGHDMSGVDFAGIIKEETVYLIEVKNFKQYTDRQIEKSLDDFVNEIVEKGMDSLKLIGIIKKHLDRKFWYKAIYSLVNRFSWINPEWYLWTAFYRLTIEEKNAIFVLLIDSDYDLKEVQDKLSKELFNNYKKVIVQSITDSKSLEGLDISAV